VVSTIAAALLLGALPHAEGAPATCAKGPQTEGDTIVGTPCDDTIHAPRGITAVFGNGGDDTLFGGRGNDSLYGGEGDDRLYGGVGDDHVRGGPGNDLLSGGFGADSLDGEAGDDFVRGDATIDTILNSGGGNDTLSYATGVTPGFPNQGEYFKFVGFPDSADGRGVYIDLSSDPDPSKGFANDGLAPAGGGVDELGETGFETVIGTPFPDFIVGSPGAETIYGGGGADVILGEGGADQIHGGAEGDSCKGDPEASIECERSDAEVEPRDPGAIAVGLMTPPGAGPPAPYLTGSSGADRVAASYSGEPPTVSFELLQGSAGAFDASPSTNGGCLPPGAGKVVCPLPAPPDSIVLAGLGGDDQLSAPDFPETTSVILLGGEAADDLSGGATEDALVDGPGEDSVSAGAGDDAVPNNAGTDVLHAGSGDDLFIDDAICDGDLLDGGEGRDNANWANFKSPASIDQGQGLAGEVGGEGQPYCESGSPTQLRAIEDIEGTGGDDTLVGDSGPNQLLGRSGADSFHAAGGDDSILANSGDSDPVIDCGEGWDTAQIDIPTSGYEDAMPTGCEAVHERKPNSFRPPDTPPAPGPPGGEPSSSSPQALDLTPPRTKILHRPGKLVLTRSGARRVVFAFSSNEPGSTFRCRLDRDRYRLCRSPRAYRLRPGGHVLRIFAVDPAGNRDRSPAFCGLRVARLSVHSSRSHHRRGRSRRVIPPRPARRSRSEPARVARSGPRARS
jgi:Ca2+-binding RTX toxin-like protein